MMRLSIPSCRHRVFSARQGNTFVVAPRHPSSAANVSLEQQRLEQKHVLHTNIPYRLIDQLDQEQSQTTAIASANIWPNKPLTQSLAQHLATQNHPHGTARGGTRQRCIKFCYYSLHSMLLGTREVPTATTCGGKAFENDSFAASLK
jgi:hypothetical protein